MSISEADKRVLQQLAANGDNAVIPRPVMHFFYGEVDQLSELNQRIAFPGWNGSELAKGSDDYRLTVTKVTDLTEESVQLMMSEVEQATAGLDLDYDGWETSVEQSS